MFFKLKKYSFKPSYDAKHISKIKKLNDTYEELFIRYIKKEKFSKEEEKELFNGIQEVSIYVKSALYFQIVESFNSKLPIEKKAGILFEKLKNQYEENFSEFIEEEFSILSEDSVYEAIGMIDSKNIFNKKEKANIISFIKNIMFYKVINFLENKVNSFKVLQINFDFISEDHDEEEYIDNLLLESNLKKSLNEDLYNRLKEGLLKRDLDKDLIPYVNFLIDFKNKCFVL